MIDTSVTLEQLNARNKNALMENMGIEFVDINSEYLTARMPVDQRTRQPLGLMHGGASAALAETVGSTAAYLSVNRSKYYTLGLEIKCNHIKSVSSGYVFGTARAVHIGKKTQVWQIEIKDEKDNLACLSTLTMIAVEIEAGMEERFKDMFLK